jgi:hypothetical protein
MNRIVIWLRVQRGVLRAKLRIWKARRAIRALGTAPCPKCGAGTLRGEWNFYNVYLRCDNHACDHVPLPEPLRRAMEKAEKRNQPDNAALSGPHEETTE